MGCCRDCGGVFCWSASVNSSCNYDYEMTISDYILYTIIGAGIFFAVLIPVCNVINILIGTI